MQISTEHSINNNKEKLNNKNNNKDNKFNNNNNIFLKSSINDYNKFFSRRVLNPCELTDEELEAFKISGDFYSYGAGIPSKDFFPLQGLKFKFRNVDKEVELSENELNSVQQYSSLPGLDKLTNFIRDLQKKYHNLSDYNDKNKEWDVCLTTGAQHGLDCIFKTIFNNFDSILVEWYTYGGLFCLSKPSNVNTIPIEMDDRGMNPKKLRELLVNWYSSSSKSNMNFPKAIYIIPNQNPTGIIYDIDRKLEIYEICREFDLLIIEDDPHFFLQFKTSKINSNDNSIGNRKLEKSFLSLDQDNRVIRVDTFSKFISSGIRMGILTSNKILIDKLSNEVNSSCFHTSGLTQISLLKLFECWGLSGFENHIKKVQDLLIERRDMMKQLIDKHLKDLVSYKVPDCGLYYWIKLNNVECSLQFFKNTLKDQKVYLGLGISHTPDRIKTPYVRITFSYMNYEETDIAFKILSQCLKQNKSNYIKSNQI